MVGMNLFRGVCHQCVSENATYDNLVTVHELLVGPWLLHSFDPKS